MPATILPASSLYAIAALEAGHSYVNFTPSLGPAPAAIDELARLRRTRYYGCDGKTGETLMKSVLAPMFARRNLRVLSWVGHNIFGNMDAQVLDDPANKQAKLSSKDHLVGEILGYRPQTLVSIECLPDLGDWKTAWDHVHFAGFLGLPMTLQFIWQGCDSVLAAPLVLDLVRFTELAWRRGAGRPDAVSGQFFQESLRHGRAPIRPAVSDAGGLGGERWKAMNVAQVQKRLFTTAECPPRVREHTASTFADNMKLPVHRWFRFSAGFGADWAEQTIRSSANGAPIRVLDPFAGSGTTLLAAESAGAESYGIEAHPFLYRIARAKLARQSDPAAYFQLASSVSGRRQTPQDWQSRRVSGADSEMLHARGPWQTGCFASEPSKPLGMTLQRLSWCGLRWWPYFGRPLM